jgi:hypothetical protein
MACNIQLLTPDDLPELSRFLTAGFRTSPQPDCAAPEVLRPKYLEPLRLMFATSAQTSHRDQRRSGLEQDRGINGDQPRSYIARHRAGQITGHLGLCTTAFEGQLMPSYNGRVTTIDIIDWLGSPDHQSVGMSLMRLAYQAVATRFGLGLTRSALPVGQRVGYKLRGLVPGYNGILCASSWRRMRGSGMVERTLRLAKDAISQVLQLPPMPPATILLQWVSAFGPEITSVVEKAKAHAILAYRDPARLNTFLCFPRQQMSSWHPLDDAGRLCGLAVLNLVPQDQGRMHTGKIVDCVLDDMKVTLWHAATLALTRALVGQGAHVAQVYASTPWIAESPHRSGYTSRFAVKFHIRDRLGLIPHDAVFNLTPLEGDYAYT